MLLALEACTDPGCTMVMVAVMAGVPVTGSGGRLLRFRLADGAGVDDCHLRRQRRR